MTIDENQEYSLPVLDIIETNLEVAINKVRSEKERKIQREIGRLQSMVLIYILYFSTFYSFSI